MVAPDSDAEGVIIAQGGITGGWSLYAKVCEMGLVKLNETLVDFSGGGVSDEKVEALLAENAERNLTVLLVKSIHQATKLQSRLSVKGMRPRGVSVEIGLVPKVVVKFASA